MVPVADIVAWLDDHAVNLGVILGLAIAAIWLARVLVPRAFRKGVEATAVPGEQLAAQEERERRSETLSRAIVWVVQVAVFVIALFLVLGEIGIALGPLLAGAGVAGIALGFGAQSFVKDALAGFFILLENQFGRGDVIRIAGVSGTVEEVNFRRTVLRDLDGVLHTVPNGEITVASNLTRGYSGINLDVSVGYGEDLDRAIEVLNAVGQELAADPDFAPLIVETPQVLRVAAFEDSGIAIKISGHTLPMKHWQVTGELRRRIKLAFDREGIEIPFPHRVVVRRQEEPAGGGAAARPG